MILVPAVDIREGRAVRLRQGDFEEETVYADEPLEAARSFVEVGAQLLHVVDLDGARDGRPANLTHLERIARELEVSVQYGGGLRSPESVERALAAGAERVVIGTAAYRDPAFLEEAIGEWGDRVAVAVDVRDGRVSVAGWTERTEMRPDEVIRRLQGQGVERFVYTDVERDGTLEGPDLKEVGRVAEAIEGRFLYSGGVSSLDDLRALRALGVPGLAGVISGKALYEQRFGVAEAQEALAG
jgi:phosphoribosylformimino-5-aminoimidazole carboxamide ribotide isomerase